jgi:primosomal protein N' (replication factor Y)
MSGTIPLRFLQEAPVKPPVQHELFGEGQAQAQVAGLFADIVFDRPLDHAYTYHIPANLAASVQVGKRVLAPFGKGDRLTVGYCVGVNEHGPDKGIKELARVIDDAPLLTDNLLRLTRWLADYYLCSWGQVLTAVVPAGARRQAGTRQRTFLEAVPESELPQPFPLLTPKQAALLEHLRKAKKPLEPVRLAQLAQCGLGPVDALVTKGVARRLTRRVDMFTPGPDEETFAVEAALKLNGDQERVWTPIELAVRQGGFHAFLLHGVTGSGKTEIYLRAIEQTMRQGYASLVLVPEISLTPQTIQRFRGRFGEVAILHSHLGDAERGSQWRRIAAGDAQVIVGARSAVFAPAKKLGLIVIDEEHESSFKQESTPRYHARDVGVMRARLENIPILLGSATPSLESWHNAQRGQYTLLTLPNRVLDRALPQVTLVDLRHERPQSTPAPLNQNWGKGGALSPTLERAMREALRGNGQVMLLLNRRGFSTHVFCPLCGHVEACKFCDLALTHHRQRGILLCHYCGYEQEPPDLCPKCGHHSIRFQGLGTEKLEEEIERKFPGFVVRRMDSDTMKKPGSHAQVLSAFRHGLIHILLGTQMIAKGLDFPNVTLVGVINADIGLHMPDFRSAERTFQILAQVAGRTGRGERGGRVLVQTFNPEQPCVALAAGHDYVSFVEAELAHRKAHGYPPYQRLARLIVRSRNAESAGQFADKLAASFTNAMKQPGLAAAVRLLGPAEAPVFRLKGYFRFHFQLQSSSSGALHQVLRAVLPLAKQPDDVEFTIDVDPHNML